MLFKKVVHISDNNIDHKIHPVTLIHFYGVSQRGNSLQLLLIVTGRRTRAKNAIAVDGKTPSDTRRSIAELERASEMHV